jgi:hypothetical protein
MGTAIKGRRQRRRVQEFKQNGNANAYSNSSRTPMSMGTSIQAALTDDGNASGNSTNE